MRQVSRVDPPPALLNATLDNATLAVYINCVEQEAQYSVAELARLGGVSRRSVRYYVQEGLLPAPLGLGRGRHYGRAHLEGLLKIKSMQERGMSLAEIRRELSQGSGTGDEPPSEVLRSAWTRFELAPGLELQVSSELQLPSPSKLVELADWCRRYFRHSQEEESDD